MKASLKALSTALAVTWLCTCALNAQENQNRTSKLGGFLAASVGGFKVSFPGVAPGAQAVGEEGGFDDVYGSKSGLSYGFELGGGLADIGLFAVVKIRSWQKTGRPVIIGSGSFDGKLTWEQLFITFGGRYFLVKPSQRYSSLLPFVGAGLIKSKATETIDGELTAYGETETLYDKEDVDGTGLYLEGGCTYYVTHNASINIGIEYSDLNLGISESGQRFEIEGGGGLYLSVGASLFFGRPMKSK